MCLSEDIKNKLTVSSEINRVLIKRKNPFMIEVENDEEVIRHAESICFSASTIKVVWDNGDSDSFALMNVGAMVIEYYLDEIYYVRFADKSLDTVVALWLRYDKAPVVEKIEEWLDILNDILWDGRFVIRVI